MPPLSNSQSLQLIPIACNYKLSERKHFKISKLNSILSYLRRKSTKI